MRIIDRIDWNPEPAKLRIKNFDTRDSVDLRVTLRLDVIKPSPSLELTIVMIDCNTGKEVWAKMDNLLPVGYIPKFAINSLCFETEMGNSDFGSIAYRGALAMVLAERMAVLMGRHISNRESLTVIVTLADFRTSGEVSLEEVSHLFQYE